MAGPFDNLTFGFGADDPKSFDAMQLRQRIALAMLSQKKGYPKNLGEGLTAIGDALGDRAAMASLERIQAARDVAAKSAADKGATIPDAARPPPGSTDPSTGQRSEVSDAAPVLTADATSSDVPTPRIMAQDDTPDTPDTPPPPYFPAPSTAQASAPPPPPAPPPGPLNDAQASQLASLVGAPKSPAQPSYFPTASLNNGPAVPQPNPTPAAGDLPPAAISPTLAASGADGSGLQALAATGAGSPPESAGNPPIPFLQMAQARPLTGIKPSSAPSEPVPEPKAEPRYQTPPQFSRPGAWETPPRIAEPGPRQLYFDRLSKDPTYSPTEQAGFAERAAELERRRQEDFKQQTEAFTTRNEQTKAQDLADKALERDKARRELELQAMEQKRQAAEYAERITRHLGGRDPAAIEAQLAKSQASVAGIPAIADSIQRVRNIADKMYTGRFADAEEFLSQVMPGWVGFDPARGPATQQFKTAMTDIMAAHRAAVVGPGSQSGPELALLQKSTAADAKLNKDTIKESIDAAERLMVKTAIAHQNQVQLYSGNFDPDRTRNVYGSFGIPGMENIVPQRAVNNLFTYKDNEQALKDFDEKYHTPGLAQRILGGARRPQ